MFFISRTTRKMVLGFRIGGSPSAIQIRKRKNLLRTSPAEKQQLVGLFAGYPCGIHCECWRGWGVQGCVHTKRSKGVQLVIMICNLVLGLGKTGGNLSSPSSSFHAPSHSPICQRMPALWCQLPPAMRPARAFILRAVLERSLILGFRVSQAQYK